jgi:hypothetical protein
MVLYDNSIHNKGGKPSKVEYDMFGGLLSN